MLYLMDASKKILLAANGRRGEKPQKI